MHRCWQKYQMEKKKKNEEKNRKIKKKLKKNYYMHWVGVAFGCAHVRQTPRRQCSRPIVQRERNRKLIIAIYFENSAQTGKRLAILCGNGVISYLWEILCGSGGTLPTYIHFYMET